MDCSDAEAAPLLGGLAASRAIALGQQILEADGLCCHSGQPGPWSSVHHRVR